MGGNKWRIYALLAAMMFMQAAHGKGTSWIGPDFPPDPESSEVEQAQKWALCAATLEVFAELTREHLKKPSTADTIQAYASGAKTAIMGVFFAGLPKKLEGKSDIETQRIFKNTKDYAVMASESFPELKKKEVMSRLELALDKAIWFADLDSSAAHCLRKDVLTFQQMYIDISRQLAFGVK